MEINQDSLQQHTLKTSIGCTGIGLHSGERVTMTLHPAAADTGIVFRRTDMGGASVAARHDNVSATFMCTTISNGAGAAVATIEHLMSALAGVRVDNAVVEVDGPEVPIMDGSAAPFVFLIECAGVEEQAAPRRAVQVLKTVEVFDGARSASISPSDGFSVSFEISYAHPLIGRQICYFDHMNGSFKRELCRARTYGFVSDVAMLRERGLALGGSLDNAVVFDDDGIVNEEGLRYDDELVRHKTLDAIGDLYLVGGPILGHMHGVGSGHAMNHRLLQEMFADPTAWRRVELEPAMAAASQGWESEAVAASA